MLKKKKSQPRLEKNSAKKEKKATVDPIAQSKETPAEIKPMNNTVIEGKEGVGKISHRPIIEEMQES